MVSYFNRSHNSDPGLTSSVRYGRLSVRRVDLVGDYAGQELFLVEGDSLLLRCFSSANLDFDRESQ